MDMPIASIAVRITLVLALLPVIFVVASLAWNRPPLFDPPGFQTRLKTYFTTHVAETRENHPFPELRPRTFDIAPEILFRLTLDTVSRRGWIHSSLGSTPHALSAVVTTPLWRFKDDVEIRVLTSHADQSFLYVRSESRQGKGDLGANLGRVMGLVTEIEERVEQYKNKSQL